MHDLSCISRNKRYVWSAVYTHVLYSACQLSMEKGIHFTDSSEVSFCLFLPPHFIDYEELISRLKV